MTETKNLKLKTYETATDGQELVASYIDNTSDNFKRIDEFCTTDKTLSVEGGIADAKITGENISQLKEDLGNKNYELSFIDGKLISKNDGNVYEDGSYSCTDYLEIIPCIEYILKTAQWSDLSGYALYDKYYDYISGDNFASSGEYATKTIVIPKNAKYIRISCLKTKTSNASLKIGRVYNSIGNMSKNVYCDIDNINSFISKNIVCIKDKNLFNKELATDGYYITGDGTITQLEYFYLTDYIEVEYGKRYFINPSYEQYVPIFDKNKNVIGNCLTTNGYFEITKRDAKYIRVYGLLSQKNSDMVCPDGYPTTYIPYYEVLNDNVEYLAINKNKIQKIIGNPTRCVQIGDSITWYDGNTQTIDGEQVTVKGYASYLRDIGMIVDNQGVSGACITNLSTYTDISEKVDNIDFTQFDICTIAGGVNDYEFWNSPMGDFANSNFDKGLFIQAYQYIIEKIISENKNIKIILMTPLQETQKTDANTQGLYLKDYVNKIKEIGDYYGIPVLDLYGESGLNKINMSTLTIDGLHPNNDGYKLICEHSLVPYILNH